MRILFVLSATLWSWLVGRTISFGPSPQSLWWCPNMHASTWYRLTPNPYNIPYRVFPYISFAFALLAVPTLFIDDDIIHILTVLRLVSEHAHVPLFTAHVHSEYVLTGWPFANALLACLTTVLIAQQNAWWALMATPCTIISACIHAWFFTLQLHLLCSQAIVRQERSYEERQPRTV